MRRIICLLLCAVLLCGCGSSEKNADSTQSTTNVDEEKLKSEGYTDLAGVAYGKMEDSGDKPNVSLVYLTENPEEAFYLWSGIQRKLLGNDVESDTTFSWGDKEYILNDESNDKMTADNAEDYVPKEWADLMRKMESGYKINNDISEDLGNSIDKAIEEFVNEYLEETKKELNVIDGFQEPDYEKFNSYASENGLDGTLIYIEGKILSQTQLGRSLDGMPTLALVIEQEDGNKWCAGVTSEYEIEEINDKNVRIFGTYQGFSDKMELPGISVVVKNANDFHKARIEIEENGEYTEVWNFYDDWVKPAEEAENKVNEETAEQPQETNALTTGQRNALDKAKSYLKHSNFSYQGLIEQLKYEKFSEEDSTYAADNCGANWNEQALGKAKGYLSHSAFSYTGLIEQLQYEEFTAEQATYAVDNCGADWNAQAANKAKSYLSHSSLSREGLIEQLEYEGFTHEQAVYGVEQNGY